MLAGLLAIAVAATTAPSLLAYNVSPSPTFLNQALAFALWGAWAIVLVLRPGATGGSRSTRGAWPLLAALAGVAMAALWSWGPGALPASLGISAVATLAAAAVVVASGAHARAHADAVELFLLLCVGFAVAGVVNLGIGVVQVFAPGLPDGDWIAHSNIVGRAVGNLRQPNHLSSLLLWAAIAVIALTALRRLSFAVGAPLFTAMVFGVVLTASRTGLVSVGLLALWGLADRRLDRRLRVLLVSAPVVYAITWKAMAWWAEALHHTFGGAARLAETDVSGSRFGIWANTLALIRDNPWAGVGFGEFNFAWTLTPFPGRPTAFFDHTHNLPLQLAVELGLPLAVVLTGLLVWGMWRVARNAAATAGDLSLCLRAALLMVVMIGLHSLLEYPLWYAYFLLPTAWVFGFGLGAPGAPPGSRAPLAVAGGLTVLLAALSVWDYSRVAEIFAAPEGAPPLHERIARGQRGVLFSHHADYAAVTSDTPLVLREGAFDRATHYLLDTRLMMAWAEELAAQGRLDDARHLAERLREFRNPLSKEFLGACETATAASAAPPFQCQPPAHVPGWREFLPR